jgi:hypothetical protein
MNGIINGLLMGLSMGYYHINGSYVINVECGKINAINHPWNGLYHLKKW